jgi:hypothetical protein
LKLLILISICQNWSENQQNWTDRKNQSYAAIRAPDHRDRLWSSEHASDLRRGWRVDLSLPGAGRTSCKSRWAGPLGAIRLCGCERQARMRSSIAGAGSSNAQSRAMPRSRDHGKGQAVCASAGSMGRPMSWRARG